MEIGLIGCGNMARALARGWGRPLLCADPIAERARALAAEVGGEALSSNAEVAARADLLVLCHKPAQLAAVAAEVGAGGASKTPVASILAVTPLAALRDAYPGRPVYRFIPSLPVEVRQGAVVQAAGPGLLAGGGDAGGGGADVDGGSGGADAGPGALDATVSALFAELGTLVVLDDALVDVAMGLMSCAPAYVALVAEAQVDAGVRRGIPAAQGAQLVVQTLAGTAELLRRRDYDTMAVRREVSSPGGLTARGVDALERAGLRRAFSDALDAVLEPSPQGTR
jgi:pyrroline-5-carboxylate reductase